MTMASAPAPAGEHRLAAGLSVTVFGAKGDGRTDDTAAFLRGLATAEKRQLPLVLPAGCYRVTMPLTVNGLTLCGLPGDTPPTLLIDQKNGPGLHLISGAVTDLTVRYAETHHSFHPAMRLSAAGCLVSRVTVENAYDGILFDDEGPSNPGRSNVHNVDIVGLQHLGVRVTNTYDVACLRHITVRGGASFQKNGTGFLFGKNDDVRVSHCTVIGGAVGFSFADLPAGDDQGETFSTWGSFRYCRTEGCERGLYVRSHFPTLRMAPLLFHHCDFAAGLHALEVAPCGANISLYACTLAADTGAALHILGAHDLLCNDCRILAPAADGVYLSGGRHIVLHHNRIAAADEPIRVGTAPRGLVTADNLTDEKEARI